MTKHLRKYINQILSEAMVQPDSVSEEYAIWTDLGHFDIAVPGKRYNFVLIEYKEMLSEMRGVSNKLKKLGGLENVSDQKKWDILDDFFHVVFNSVKAVIRVGIPEEENSCNGAWEVLRSAAVEGLGPTMYDLVMSKSPNGLFSDRGSVSDEAFRYWEISANNRDDISKHFLDNADNLYTVTAFDNCDVYGSFDQMELIKFATRQMAIDFFNSNFPVEHQTMIEKMDTGLIMYIGDKKGEDYFNIALDWMKNNIENFSEEIPTAVNAWEKHKDDEEHDLFAKFVTEPVTDRNSIMNLSYNTDYAKEAYKSMFFNFYYQVDEEARKLMGDNAFERIFKDGIEEMVDYFFEIRYNRGV